MAQPTTSTLAEQWTALDTHLGEHGDLTAIPAIIRGDVRKLLREAFYSGAMASLYCIGDYGETMSDAAKRLLTEIDTELGITGKAKQ